MKCCRFSKLIQTFVCVEISNRRKIISISNVNIEDKYTNRKLLIIGMAQWLWGQCYTLWRLVGEELFMWENIWFRIKIIFGLFVKFDPLSDFYKQTDKNWKYVQSNGNWIDGNLNDEEKMTIQQITCSQNMLVDMVCSWRIMASEILNKYLPKMTSSLKYWK